MKEEPEYAKYWDRCGAYLLDALIIGLITFGINYLNFISLKSFYIYLPMALIAILYKPYMESKYQATIGKMAVDIKVVGENFEQIDFEKSLLRSLIVMIPPLLFLPVYYLAFENPNLMALDGWWGFSSGISETYPTLMAFNSFYSLIFLVDLIVFLANYSKRKRSLKDVIAKTYVIKEAS